MSRDCGLEWKMRQVNFCWNVTSCLFALGIMCHHKDTWIENLWRIISFPCKADRKNTFSHQLNDDEAIAIRVVFVPKSPVCWLCILDSCCWMNHPHVKLCPSLFFFCSFFHPVWIWIWGFVSITIISLLSLLGVVLVPILNQSCFKFLLTFLVALAVGTLSGDALLHLLPHVSTPQYTDTCILQQNIYHITRLPSFQ